MRTSRSTAPRSLERRLPTSAARAGGLETAVVSIALGSLVVHVLDDAFLQPEPGARAADHLAGGLGLSAVLLVAAATYPFLRPGVRASIAAFVAILAGGIGAEAWKALRSGTLGGDDFTGLMALVAAPTLAFVSCIVLWRSRRRSGPWWRRGVRRLLVAVLAAYVALVVALPLAFGYAGTHVGSSWNAPASLGSSVEELTIRTADGQDLVARYLPSRNGAAILVVPGLVGPAAHARMLAEHGYGVLLLGHRGTGDSTGDPSLLGWNRAADVKAAIDYLRSRPDVDGDRIGGLGLSVGGESLLHVAATTPQLRAVVSEGAGIRSLGEQRHLPFSSQVVGWPTWAVLTASTALFSGQAPPPDLVDLVAQIPPRRVFLIHAEVGTGGEELNPYYEAAAGKSAIRWEIPGNDHVGGIRVAGQQYERRVLDFFDDALADAR